MAVRPPTRPAGQVPPATPPSAVAEALRSLLTPVAADAGVVLEEVAITRAGHRSVLTVLIDGDAEGIDLDTVAAASRAISDALDTTADSLLPATYTLEVSTPGVDRPLTERRHWVRNIGRLVAVTVPGTPSVTGRILAVEGEDVRLDVPGPKGRPGRERTVALAEVTRAVVQVELTRVAESESDPEETS